MGVPSRLSSEPRLGEIPRYPELICRSRESARKRESRDPIRLPWAPAFVGATIRVLLRLDYTVKSGNDEFQAARAR